MQAKRRAIAINAQTLITEARGNPICPQEGGEEMALGVAKAGSTPQHLGSGTGDGIQVEVRAVPDLVPHPGETPLSDRLRVLGSRGKRLRLRADLRVIPIHDRRDFQEGMHW